jgi:hypothetical protein
MASCISVGVTNPALYSITSIVPDKSTSYYRGDSISLTVTVKNIGGATGSYKLNCKLYNGTQGDVVLTTPNASDINPNTSVILVATGTIPTNAATGTYDIHTTPEISPLKTIYVDLKPANLSNITFGASQTACAGSCTVDITGTWKNTGEATASPVSISAKLTDPTGATTFIPLSGLTSIAPGVTSTYTGQAALNGALVGTYIFCPDPA